MRFFRRTAPAIVPALLAACAGLTDVAGKANLPSGVVDPATYQSPDGALGMYRQTVTQFQDAALLALRAGGLLTDELTALEGPPPHTALDGTNPLDTRRLPEDAVLQPGENANGMGEMTYEALQLVRTYGTQARGALAKYNPAAPSALRGHAYALAGYAELWLADLFCSGVPLSELEFEGDFVYKPGSTTQQIYAHAVALFDSAITLSADSARILNLARVGKGRALLAMSRDSAAARAVAQVPDDFRYEFPVAWTTNDGARFPGLTARVAAFVNVADREGRNGLPFRSGGDPRTAVDSGPYASVGQLLYVPAKYGSPARDFPAGVWGVVSPVVVAGGVEAQLIRAEAALRANDVARWAGILNALRATAGASPTPAVPPLPADSTTAAPDTLRLSVMFAERAKWLFVDGHRQGDLRRLVRQYGRPQQAVYPAGPFDGSTAFTYGTDVNSPIPASERPNPNFHGCFNRGA